MPLVVGTRLGPYEILSPLGAGGMGEVYRAHDTRLNREVAVKVLSEEFTLNPDRRARFEREARAVAALSHHNIVAVYDIGEDSGRLYMVSELVSGENLRDRLHNAALPVRETLDIATQIVDGLAAAHEAGITHRDLKPENLMLTPAKTVKILDFGLARIAADKPAAAGDATVTAHGQTRPGMVMGTPHYMSPEQARGLATDYRSDQFSLGVIMHEMLTGKQTFRRASIPEIMVAILKEDAPPLADAVPAPLRWIIERLLSKDSASRYVSTQDLYRDLRALRDHLSELTPSAAVAAIAPPPVRRRSLSPYAIVAAVIIAAITLSLVPDAGNDESGYRFTALARDQTYQLEPAWSPDGKSIAYRAPIQGIPQIFVRSAGESNVGQLTHSKQACTKPFWSPDGSTIFYYSAGTWWAIGASGGVSQKAFNSEYAVAIHPDGKTLALARQGKLFIGPASEAAQKEYRHPLFPSEALIGPLAFSPDGSRLAAIVAPNRSGGGQPADLWLLPCCSGGTPQKLSDIPRLHNVSWFPDGRHLLFQRDDGENSSLIVLDTRTNRTRALWTTGSEIDSCALSRDGKRIALSIGESKSQITEVSLPEGRVSAMLQLNGVLSTFPDWAPSGTHYLYTTASPTGIEDRSVKEDFVRTLVTRQTEGLPPNLVAFQEPRWSPDGQRIVFAIGFGSGAASRQLWISNLSGRPFPLAGAQFGWSPNWSPDGEWISYLHIGGAAGLGRHLSKIRVSAGATSVVLASDVAPSGIVSCWSPDGDWILYPAEQGPTLISPDGKIRRLLSRRRPSTFGFSKRGDLVYAIIREAGLWCLYSIDVKSGAEKQLATLDFSLDTSSVFNFSLHPDGNRFVVSATIFRDEIYQLEGFDRPKSWLDRLLRR